MLKEIGLFLFGGACGFAGATFLLKTKYETMAKEADEAAMNFIKSKQNEDEEKKEESKTEQVIKHGKDMTEYHNITKDYKIEVEEKLTDTIYRISESDFVVDDEEFDKVSLEYYPEDGLLYEDGGEVIPNVDDVVGQDNLSILHGTEDTIYIRNENLRTDYEVSKILGHNNY